MASPVIDTFFPVDGAINVVHTTELEFNVTDTDGNLNAATITVMINAVMVYQSEVALPGWTVTRAVIANGFFFLVSPLRGTWEYEQVVAVTVEAEDLIPNHTAVSMSFTVEKDAACFDGSTLTTFEQSLLVPYTSAGYVEMDRLRQDMLQWCSPSATHSLRVLFLLAHAIEIAPIMRGLVPTPTVAQKAVRLCYKTSVVTIAQNLRGKAERYTTLLAELRAAGLPQEHTTMLGTYEDQEDPFTYVALHCFFVLMAKALENLTVL